MRKDETKEVYQARYVPSWLAWAGLGVVCGIAISYWHFPSQYLMWVLTALACVLVYTLFYVYNEFVHYFNGIQIKELHEEMEAKKIIEQISCTFQYTEDTEDDDEIDGTNQDRSCLTKEEGNE